jgi:hypothetical protein
MALAAPSMFSSLSATAPGAGPRESGGDGQMAQSLAGTGAPTRAGSNNYWIRTPAEGKGLPSFNKEVRNTQGSFAADSLNRGQQTSDDALSDLEPILQLFKKLAGGDQTATQQFISPETDAISQQFGAIRNMIGSTQPRGGGTASTFANAPFEEMKQRNELATDWRRHATDMVPQLAEQKQQAGLQQQGLGVQSLAAAGQGGQQQAQLDEQKRALKWQVLGQLGGGIGSMLGGMLSK